MNTQTEASWIEEAMRLALDARWLDVPGEQGAAGAKLRVHLATRPAAPEGWVLVPKEPTPEMLDAAFELFELPPPPGYGSGNEARAAIYRAMIAAATGSTK